MDWFLYDRDPRHVRVNPYLRDLTLIILTLKYVLSEKQHRLK